jgi:hypothetical protein
MLAESLALYRAFGFVEEGIQRQQAFVRGRYYNVQRCADGPDPQPQTPSDLKPTSIDTRYAC